LMHWVPAFFLLGLIALPFTLLISYRLFFVGFGGYLAYLLMIAFDSFRVTKSICVSVLSIPSAIVQLTGYGYGFLKELFYIR